MSNHKIGNECNNHSFPFLFKTNNKMNNKLKEETLLDDVKKRNKELRIESIQNMKNEIQSIEESIKMKYDSIQSMKVEIQSIEESIKMKYDGIKLLENNISLKKKFIKLNEELIELGY